MKHKWLKKGLTYLLVAAVCCCFMPSLALAEEAVSTGNEAPAVSAEAPAPAVQAAKGTVVVAGVLNAADAAKDAVSTQAKVNKKDKSELDIKTVNGTKEDATIQVYLWKNDKTLTDAKKDNDKKEKAAEVTVSGLDAKTGEATISGTKVKLVDGKDGRYLEYVVKSEKTADLKVKLVPADPSKEQTLEVVAEPKTAAKAAVAAVQINPVAAAAETNVNAAATDTQTTEAGQTEATTTAAEPTAEATTVEVAVTKVWNDEEDKDKIRPANVTIKLFADGVDTEKTLILDANGSWKGSFKDLDKAKDGKDIVYTVQEVEVRDYSATVTGDQTQGFTVTNAHTPATVTEKVSVGGTITWNDTDDKVGKRPKSVIVRLFSNGTEVENAKVTSNNSWKYEFVDLEKLDANGNEIEYTVKEDAVTSYTTTYKGYDIVNKYKATTTSGTTSNKSSSSSSSSSRNSSSRNARTSDSTHLGLYLALMLISAGGAAAMILRRRRG